MFEAYVLSNAIEQGLRTGTVVFDMKRQLNVHRTIDLSALKRRIWDNHDDCDGEATGLKSYHSRWVDTLVTLSDNLSKATTSCRSVNTSTTAIFDTRPTEKSPAIKEKEQGAGRIAGF